MRLLEVFHRCKEAWMHLDLSGSGRYEIVNTKYLPQSNKLSASFSLLEPIDFFKDDIAALKGLYNYAAKSSNDYATSFSREKSAEETYKDAFLQKYIPVR